MKRPTSRFFASIFALTAFFFAPTLVFDANFVPHFANAQESRERDVDSADAKPTATKKPTRPRRRVAVRSADGAEPQIFVGREVADYRTVDGAGRYLLEDELGEIRIFENAQVESVLSEPEIDPDELRSKIATRLSQEFGDGFNVKSTERYLFVYNVSEGYVEWCAQLFESLADGFEKFAAKNGLELAPRAEPSIVVVFATRREFERYAAKDAPDPSRLAAYYNMQTNRVVLRDLSGVETARDASDSDDASSRGETPARRRTFREVKEILSRPNAAFNVATIVHEATHQIAFNRGVFHRTGPIALWAVEGLSLLFETPNGKTTQGGWAYRGVFPKNERQLASFRNFAARSTTGDPIRELIRQDRFMNDVQGSYSTSWALFYYLYKRKPRELARYVQKIADKAPCVEYSPEERIADFEEFFGDDWERLYQNLSRFIRNL